MTNQYLLIAHADEPYVTLFDAETLKSIRSFELPGRIAVLGKSSNSLYGFAIHRDDDCVTVINAEQELVLAITATGKQPTHFHAHGGRSIIFNDGSGDVAVFDEEAMPDFTKYRAKQPDHGSALFIDDYMLVGYLRLGSIEIYKQNEDMPCQTFDCCPVLHGATQVDNMALFGCSDGVLLLKPDADGFIMTKLNNPENTLEKVRVGMFATSQKSSLVLGNLGHGLVVIDPYRDTMTEIVLPEYPLKFSFDTFGNLILVLTADGNLQRLNMNGTLDELKNVATDVKAPKGPDKKARPTFGIGKDKLYLIDPDKQTLDEFLQYDFKQNRHTSLDFKPSAVVFLGE